MKHRFRFLGQADTDGLWTLSEDDSHHLQKVLRLELAEEIEVFDGQGHWIVGSIASLGKQEVRASVLQSFFEPKSPCEIVLLQAAMKPSSYDELLPSLVELGVDRIWIFAQHHTDRKWLSDKICQRWQRLIASASKQCKRSWLPELQIFKGLPQVLKSCDLNPFENRIVLDPAGDYSLVDLPLHKSSSLLALGSEKGLAQEELEILKASEFNAARIGPNILRAYTASLAGMSILAARRRD